MVSIGWNRNTVRGRDPVVMGYAQCPWHYCFRALHHNMPETNNTNQTISQGHANLLCIIPIFSYVTPKGTTVEVSAELPGTEFCFLFEQRGAYDYLFWKQPNKWKQNKFMKQKRACNMRTYLSMAMVSHMNNQLWMRYVHIDSRNSVTGQE